MNNSLVSFQAPYQVQTQEKPVPEPQAGQILVQVQSSAISPGTEMLVYRGQLPPEMQADDTIAALQEKFVYPMQYGYACVGVVVRGGDERRQEWVGRRVFAFQPHQRFFVCRPQEVIPIPTQVADEDALFFPNLETAVNLVQDAAPVLGERGVVFGLGVVGLLTALLLDQFPLSALTLVEPITLRQHKAQELGLTQVVSPQSALPEDFDFAVEVSGAGAALQQAIQQVGFAGRVIVGSWFGSKPVSLDLGSRFHRQRIQLISSQVSTLSPCLVSRWDKTRRAGVVWQQIEKLQPRRLITHRFPVEEAAAAYHLIDQQPDVCLQVILTY